MLSVLIPVKDWNPLSLVESLAAQLDQCGIPYEIIISDDSAPGVSTEAETLATRIPGVLYFNREKPLGRSANRNFLARKAKYPYLLFIDGDAGMADDRFVQNYIDRLSPESVLCGGTLYHPDPPENQEFLLRWTYGKAREQTDAAVRQQHPWKSFSTFNFLVPAEIFNRIRFDESITGYGHEDTFFGINLQKSGVSITHLNNGLLHLGLEPSAVYLDKIRESGANLHRLYETNSFPPGYADDINLLRAWRRLRKFGLDKILATWFRSRRKSMEKRLCGPNPSLLLLDLYKLGAISHIG